VAVRSERMGLVAWPVHEPAQVQVHVHVQVQAQVQAQVVQAHRIHMRVEEALFGCHSTGRVGHWSGQHQGRGEMSEGCAPDGPLPQGRPSSASRRGSLFAATGSLNLQ